jgi:hypothetical protein
MDLADFDLSAHADMGAEMTLLHPTHKPVIAFTGTDDLPVTFQIIGMQSKDVQAVARKIDRKKMSGTVDDERERGLDMMIAVTRGWSGNLEFEGKALPFTDANARMLYSKFDWITEQVVNFAKEPANFFIEPPKS